MRKRALALLLLPILLALPLTGCFGKGDDDTSGATDTGTGTGTGSGDPGTGSGDPGTGSGDPGMGGETGGENETGEEEEDPAPPAPEPVNETVTINLPAGPSSTGSTTFTVPGDGWMTFEIALTVAGTESSDQGAPVDNGFASDGITITLLDPDGEEQGSFDVPPGTQSGPVTGTIAPAGGVAGEWTLSAAATTLNAPGVEVTGQVTVTY